MSRPAGSPYVLDYHDLDHPDRPVFVATTPEGERYDTASLKQASPGGETEWLWPGIIPLRTVTLIEGPAGSGKSQLALDLAARASRSAAWPNGDPSSLPATQVLVVNRRDAAEVVSARFERAGGDPKTLFQFREFDTLLADSQAHGTRPIVFPYDYVALEQLVEDNSFGVIIIDSLADFCPTPKLFDETLELLEDLAARAYAAILVTSPANCRIDAQGRLKATSRWPTESVRTAWCLVRDPDDPWRRMFVAKRTNYCREPDGLAYRLGDRGVVWEAQSQINPVDPLGQFRASDVCLTDLLSEGPQPASTVFRLGGELGFSPKQLRTAGKRLEVAHQRIGFSGKGNWNWSLPVARTAAGAPGVAYVAPAAANGKEKHGASLGMYGESMGNASLTDASGDEHVEQVTNLLVSPPASPADRAVQEESEPRMSRIDTNDGRGKLEAIDDAERQDASSHAERGNERIQSSMFNLMLMLLVAFCFPMTKVIAADDDDEDSQPGLVAQYTAGGKTIDRIDGDVQFVWGEHGPDARLPAGPFSALWRGVILIRTEGKHAFHLYLDGEATVTLNGKVVISG